MKRRSIRAAGSLALAGLCVIPVAADGRDAAHRAAPFETSDLFVEINATDGDAGLQMNLGGRAWTHLTLRDPRGRIVMDVNATGPLAGWGATDMGFESAEPPFERVPLRQFRRRFPEGRYTFTGTTPTGGRLTGSDRLTHDFPAGPDVVAPGRGATVDPANLLVRWRRSTQRGIRIVRYEVVVSDEAEAHEFVAQLPARATKVTVPAEFLQRGREYAVEVLARERSGNQTITQVNFKTRA